MILLSLFVQGIVNAQLLIGDVFESGGLKYVVQSENLISNPGFESGLGNWSDGAGSALVSDNFTVKKTGGIDNSKYLVGTQNTGAGGTGSIGTGWSIEAGKSYLISYHVKYEDTSASAGSEIYLKVSLTNDKTATDEPKVVIASSNVAGGGAWSETNMVFVNTDSYAYVVARFRWLSGRLGFDNFSLHEVAEIANTEELQRVIEEAEAMYDASANGAADLQAAIDIATGYLTSTSSAEVTQAISDLNLAIRFYQLAAATSENMVDVTSFIINPNFDENAIMGWTGGGYVNFHCVEFYQATFDFYQEITGLPAGKYILKAQGFQRPTWNDAGEAYKAGTETISAYFYAKSTSFQGQASAFNSLYKHSSTELGITGTNGYVNGMGEAETMFTNTRSDYYEVEVQNIMLADGDALVIGARGEYILGGCWILFDNFRLMYCGLNDEDVIAFINQQITTAQLLLTQKMQNSASNNLSTAVSGAQELIVSAQPETTTLFEASSVLEAAVTVAKESIEAYEVLQTCLDTANALRNSEAQNEVDAFNAAIAKAQTTCDDLDATLENISAAEVELEAAIDSFRMANPTGDTPVVVSSRYVRGATMILARSEISGVDSSEILEKGYCWSTETKEPTILDNKTTAYLGDASAPIYKMDNLLPSTVYYVRAYALSTGYALGYGEVLKVITIPKGTISYGIDGSAIGDIRTRIDAAVSSAVGYMNNLSSIKGHYLSVSYSAGTPTAEASYGGYLRFGPLESYQKTGTALHEMGHTIGVGQYWYWTNTSGSPLRGDGAWLGDRATKVVQFFENDTESVLKGDATHMWPYGINGANEDTGSELLYIANAVIHQALGEDGLPPTGGFTTPAYTFESEDGKKYYIKKESDSNALSCSFVVEEKSNTFTYREMTPTTAMKNDSAAWYFNFDPVSCYYQIKNVATGNYMTYSFDGSDGIRTVARGSSTDLENFQLMRGRVDAELSAGGTSLTTRGYWIIHPEAKEKPLCLSTTTSGTPMTATFDITNSATNQRWLLLSQEEMGVLVVNKENGMKVSYACFLPDSDSELEAGEIKAAVVSVDEQGNPTQTIAQGSAVLNGDYVFTDVTVGFNYVSSARYNFLGWYSLDGELESNENPYYKKASEDLTLRAYVEEQAVASWSYGLEIEGSGELIASVEAADEVLVGTTVNLTFTPHEDYDFAGWYVGGTLLSSDVSYTLTIAEDTHIEAHVNCLFELEYAVSISEAGSIECTFASGDKLLENQPVELKFSLEDDAYQFDGWDINGEKQTSELSCVFDMTSNVRASAVVSRIFEGDERAVYFYPNPAKDVITVESLLPVGVIKIYNTQGVLVKEQQITKSKEQVDVSNLKQGMYIVWTNNFKQKIVIK